MRESLAGKPILLFLFFWDFDQLIRIDSAVGCWDVRDVVSFLMVWRLWKMESFV
jgi:hypothetical protein